MAAKSVHVVFCALASAMIASTVTPIVRDAQAQTLATDVRSSAAHGAIPVSVRATALPLHVVLRMIAQQAGLRPFLGTELLTSPTRVTLTLHDVRAEEAFAAALRGTGLKATIVSDKVVFERTGIAAATLQGGVMGTVTDANTRVPLRGATITLDGVSTRVTTGDDGTFRLASVTPGSHTVGVRLLGYVKSTKTVTVMEGQVVSLDIALSPSVSTLDQVVVTGTVIPTERKAVPNAMTVITAQELEQRGITHIDQLFRGDVPGLFVVNGGSTDAVGTVTMFSRGSTSLVSGVTTPIKTYVDGVELADSKYLSQIDPKSIERIEILAGPQASTIYGSSAINGVMQIFTKRGVAGTSRPQVTAALLSGLVENDFSTARTPQHDYSTQLTGVEGRWSYNTGGSWHYMGPWTPARQTATMSGFGGTRMQYGPVTADATLRITNTRNRVFGSIYQFRTVAQQRGDYAPDTRSGYNPPGAATVDGQTLGLTLGYAPFNVWSHELVVGRDVLDTEDRDYAAGYGITSDTLPYMSQIHRQRTSVRYATTARLSMRDHATLMVTLGADSWQNLFTALAVRTKSLTGTLAPTYQSISRQPGHNAGGFVQAQVGVLDALFFTYGLRAEWNPTYGDDAQPNMAPRYGVAYTHDLDSPLGQLTAKLRLSYGRSTRPPTLYQKDAVITTSASTIALFGPAATRLANPELGPEYQQGGEGGVELYFGHRGSLIVTRYNQTVEALIANVSSIDSVQSFQQYPDPSLCTARTDGYCYLLQSQNLNVGNIRNQGWELQGTVNAGPFTTRGTYSWTKSRTMGVNPRYRALLTGSGAYQPGQAFRQLPEHTWALGLTYARAATTLTLNMNGVGLLYANDTPLGYAAQYARLDASKPRKSNVGWARFGRAGYAMADVNASHRFSSMIEGVLQVQNLTDFYQNDFDAAGATLGRQTKLGVRFRW